MQVSRELKSISKRGDRLTHARKFCLAELGGFLCKSSIDNHFAFIDKPKLVYHLLKILIVGIATMGSVRELSAQPSAAPAPIQRYTLSSFGAVGLSDMARDPRGMVWVVPERQRHLLRVQQSPGDLKLVHKAILQSVPKGWDIESLTFLDDGRVVFGTENLVPGRDADRLLFARTNGDVVDVVETIEMPYSLWNMRAESNHGLEGLCSAAGWLFASSETVQVEGRVRYAPLGAYSLSEKNWRAYRIRLTSEKGKISALTCFVAKDGAAIEFLAVERHYQVSRLLRFSITVGESEKDVVPSVVVDLSRFFSTIPNFEGVVKEDDNHALLVVDNDTGGIRSSSEIIQVGW